MNTTSIKIIEPQTPAEFEAYFLVRYNTLRAPWGQPPGSEKDEMENECIHAMAVDENNNVLGVARLQFNSDATSQLRYMGVVDAAQGLGVGRMLIQYMESMSTLNGFNVLVLQARETAVPFYEKCGYTIKEKTFLMWGAIQHYLMSKKL